MANYASKVIEIALAEVGYIEKKSAKDLYSKQANAGSANYTKYGKEMHDLYPSVMDYPAYWCDAFVDWCFQKAYGVSNAKGLLGGNFDDYTPNSANLYKKKNAWHTKNPKVGDQIFFHNGTRICHTGLVYKVTDTHVYTVEGNTTSSADVVANGGCVAKKMYNLNNSKISGYGRPKYDAEPNESKPTTTPTATTPTPSNSVEKNVKAGQKWLNTYYGGTIKKHKRELLEVDGVYGAKTRGAALCVWKDLANRKYGANLTPYNENFLGACKAQAAKMEIEAGDDGTLPLIAQLLLSAKGYYTGDMDAKFDIDMKNAVKKYQTDKKLSVDGIIGAETWNSLFN